ncbi:MAG: DUF1732 domain-containing protein, partial [Bdellovibrionota bacterium]
MTGFGRSSTRTRKTRTKGRAAESGDVNLDISLRAVNGRYLELRFHMPREYAGLEGEFKAIISEKFSRGTLDIYVARRAAAAKSEVTVNALLAQEWLSGYRKLGKELGLKSEASLELISRVPDVMIVTENSDITDAEKKLARSLVEEAAEACDVERRREGEALRTELESLCSKLEAISKQMETLKVDANAELERRYRDRLKDALGKFELGGAVDDQRLAQEVVIQLDRADVSEELQRLKEHLKAYRQLLKSPEPQGKKLDFYAQELLREVNTIGSKSHIAKLTSLV